MGKKRKTQEDGEDDLPKNRQTSKIAKKSEKRLIIILEGAHLETCKVSINSIIIIIIIIITISILMKKTTVLKKS